MPRKRKKETEEPPIVIVEEPTIEETPINTMFERKTSLEPEPEPTVEDELKALKKTIRAIAKEFPLWPGATDTTFLEKVFGPAYTETLGKLKAACK